MLTQETIDALLQHYGYLRQSLKVSHDWFEKRKIERKLNALEEILDIKIKTPSTKLY